MSFVIAQPCIVKDGACVPVCPVAAIFIAEAVPERWGSFIFKNRAFFG